MMGHTPAVVTDLEMSQSDQPTGSGTIVLDDDFRKEIKYDKDDDDYPMGWPKFAQSQLLHYNGSFHRAFKYISQRLMHYWQGHLAFLEQELIRLDRRDAASGHPRLKSLSPWQRGLNSETSGDGSDCEANEYDKLMATMKSRYIEYTELVLRDKEMRDLQEIGRNQHVNMFYNLYRHNMLDKQGRVFFTDPDDIITTKTDRVFHPVVEKLAFTSVGKFLMRPIRRNTKPGDGTGRYAQHLDVSWLGKLAVGSVVFLSAFLLLSPALLLYLAPLGKVQSAIVVVTFVFIFTLSLSLVHDIRMDSVLVGVAAFMAVLVTFLANLGSNCSQQ